MEYYVSFNEIGIKQFTNRVAELLFLHVMDINHKNDCLVI